MGQWLGEVLVYAVIGLLLTLILWPNERTGQRFLRRWGIEDADRALTDHAVRYLRQRRSLYPVTFLGVFVLTSLTARVLDADRFLESDPLHYFAPLLLGLLLAEAIAALRPARGVRTAVLARRGLRDLIPRWAVVVLVVLASLATMSALASLFARPWAARYVAVFSPSGEWVSADGGRQSVSSWVLAEMDDQTEFLVLGGVLVGLIVVLGVVRLAVVRRSVVAPDHHLATRLDTALRIRSARVALGIGLEWMALMVVLANYRLTLLRTAIPHPDDPVAALTAPLPWWLEHTSPVEQWGVYVLLVAFGGWMTLVTSPRRVPWGVA